MSFAAFLLVPLVAMVPTSGEVADRQPPAERLAAAAASGSASPSSPFDVAADNSHIDVGNQVRIEQRMTIRIAPRPAPVQRNMLMDLPQRPIASRFVERKIGKCLPVAGIAGVQADAGRLLLFMRDSRLVSAELERACRPRDFYSGFYLARSDDGRICVDRDILLSRSGANCKLSRIRQLVEADD